MVKRVIMSLGILGSLLSREIPLATLLGFVMILATVAEQGKSHEAAVVLGLSSPLPFTQFTRRMQRLLSTRRDCHAETES